MVFMKVLIISHAFHPTVSPRAIRWVHISREWAGKGHEVDVVTARTPGSEARENSYGVEIHRVGNARSERWRERFKEKRFQSGTGEDRGDATGRAAARKSAAGTLAALLMWIRAQTWKKLWWPDSSCLWYFPARKKALQLLHRKNHDALISVSLPFTGHWAALYAKERYPAGRWLADSGDPFCFLDKPEANNGRLYARKNLLAEKRVFERADALAVTTPETRERYDDLFPGYRSKIHVIPPLLAPQEVDGGANSPFPAENALRLVYIGRLYRDNRNPGFLLSLFEKLVASHPRDRLELHFFGSIGDCAALFERYRSSLNKRIFIHGTVGHEVALRAMNEADILVNIGNVNSYQLPSKVVEYAGTGKPVLNLAGHPGDSSASFFAEYPSCMSLYRKDGGVAREQVEAAGDFIARRRTLPAEELDRFLAPFRAEQVAARYEELIRG